VQSAPPAIAPNYLSTQADRNIAAAPALQKYAPEEFKPGPGVVSEDDLACAAGNIGTTIFHPVGTCAKGRRDDAMAVVDSQLRVIGVVGLRVVDASIMPIITSGNTNLPTIMIAEKAAQMVLAARAASRSR
jgi:choline dehydrogenase